MRVELQQRCDLFVANRDKLKKAFAWETDMMNVAAAGVFADAGVEVDVEKMKACEKLLKSKTGVFSDFRSHTKMPLLCKMALSENPEAYFDTVQALYERINTSKMFGDEYKILTAMIIVDHCDAAEYEKYIADTEEIYGMMKKEHPWITSREDYPFAAMIAVADADKKAVMEEVEKNFDLLGKTFKNKDAVQALSNVLALQPAQAEEKCTRVRSIYENLKAQKHKYGSGEELAVLGTLLACELSDEDIVSNLIEADEYLKRQKGFGDFSFGSDYRRIFAAQLVLETYKAEGQASDAAILGTALAITIALEVCMIIMMSSVVAATSANN